MSQIIKKVEQGIPFWLSGEDLQLPVQLKAEWDIYTEDLSSKGLSWINAGDRVDWNGSKKEGMSVVDTVYNNLYLQYAQSPTFRPFKGLWEKSAPLKMKLFLWLVLMNKNLTWENMK